VTFKRLWFGLIAGAGAVAAHSHGSKAHTDPTPTEKATHNFIAHVLLPLWMLPGLGDYLCHKRSKIEETSGTHESLTHILMISLTGAGVLTGLFFEVDEAALGLMAASALLHEGVVLWEQRRPPSATEQHMHSFLEVLPFTALASMWCLHPEATATLLQTRSLTRFRLKPKQNRESPAFLASILLMGTLSLALPYAEEFVRCFRVDRTILPRK
jgi:hypothetical protein